MASLDLPDVEVTKNSIGSGAYAVVLEVKFRGLSCVGKRLHSTLLHYATPAEKDHLLQRFQTECRLLSQLRHPNIVQFLGTCYEKGSDIPILVMEHLYSTLSSTVDRYSVLTKSVLPNEVAYPIFRDVCQGLCYLHGREQPIIHRDLSANNVLLTSDMSAKISDLGVAKILDLSPCQIKTMTAGPGAPVCMPPEVLGNKPIYSTKVDIFSYGVLLLHVLCGEWPLPEDPVSVDPKNSDAVIGKSEVERRKAYLDKLDHSHNLKPVILQCLSNNPTCRPTAPNVLATVTKGLESLVVSPKPRNKLEWLECFSELQELRSRGGFLEERVRLLTLSPPPPPVLSPSSPSSSGDGTSGRGTHMPVRITSSNLFQPGAKLEWHTLGENAQLPFTVMRAHTVTIGNKVYVGGGETKGERYNHMVLCYDCDEQVWTILPVCPVRRFGLTKLQEQLVIVGGERKDSNEKSDMVYSYKTDTCKWEELIPRMTSVRSCVTAVGYESNLFVFGGIDEDGNCTSCVEVFRPRGSSSFEAELSLFKRKIGKERKESAKEKETQLQSYREQLDTLQLKGIQGYLRGVDILEQASITIKPAEARSFEWKGYGFRIHIPKGALPTDLSECTIHITASLSGQFQFPEGSELVSGVYWLSCPVKFAKPVTLDIQHCVAIERPQQNSLLTFARAHCSQRQLPYKFDVMEGGEFSLGSSYGSISVKHFSCFTILQYIPSLVGFSQPSYMAQVFQSTISSRQWQIDVVVTKDLSLNMMHVRRSFSGKTMITSLKVNFVDDKITVCVDNEETDRNWNVLPITHPSVEKTDVDNFCKDRALPKCDLYAIWKGGNVKLLPHVKLQLSGAKPPKNYFQLMFIPRTSPCPAVVLSPTPGFDERPTMPLILQVPSSNYNILHQIGAKYYELCAHLLCDDCGARATALKQQHGSNAYNINFEIISEWLRGSGKQPVSWRTLDGVLRTMQLRELADEIASYCGAVVSL